MALLPQCREYKERGTVSCLLMVGDASGRLKGGKRWEGAVTPQKHLPTHRHRNGWRDDTATPNEAPRVGPLSCRGEATGGAGVGRHLQNVCQPQPLADPGDMQ